MIINVLVIIVCKGKQIAPKQFCTMHQANLILQILPLFLQILPLSADSACFHMIDYC